MHHRIHPTKRLAPMKTLLLAAAASPVLSGTLLTPAAFAQTSLAASQVKALEGLAGSQPGWRCSGAKGICARGHFIGNAAGPASCVAVNYWGGNAFELEAAPGKKPVWAMSSWRVNCAGG